MGIQGDNMKRKYEKPSFEEEIFCPCPEIKRMEYHRDIDPYFLGRDLTDPILGKDRAVYLGPGVYETEKTIEKYPLPLLDDDRKYDDDW